MNKWYEKVMALGNNNFRSVSEFFYKKYLKVA